MDVDASQAKQNSAGAGEHQTEMTWAQAAAAELGFDVQHEPDEQLLVLFRLNEETPQLLWQRSHGWWSAFPAFRAGLCGRNASRHPG